LLNAGASPAAGRGEALYWAVRYGKPFEVEKLLKAGVDPNRQTEEGHLPLHGAIRRFVQGDNPRDPIPLDMIRLMLLYGADPEVPDANVKTAIQFAAENHYGEAMRKAVKPR
jgi:ankyrin repeat protein